MSARSFALGLFVLLASASCGGTRGVAAPEPRSATSPDPVARPPAPCPRVERAKPMWSGFLVDVPSAAMVHALDSVVPIQITLGNTFCAESLRDCRPLELTAIDLTDEYAKEAHVRVRLTRDAGELGLVLRKVEDAWRADPASLSDYLARCRGR